MHAEEVSHGERFEFGKNWSRFLTRLSGDRIAAAENSLKDMLEVQSLVGKRFLDIGSGSGLFSLAARRLGAQVHSFEYDPMSVACTCELRRRYYREDRHWTIEEGSALDGDYLKSRGKFDIVYSWGVLHHTGNMWAALDNAQLCVDDNGILFIAIYNDMGSQTERWRWIKRTYNNLPKIFKIPFAIIVSAPSELKSILRSVLRMRLRDYTRSWVDYGQTRGMNRWHDIIDWVGGYPYEVAKPEEIFDFFRVKGFTLNRIKCGGVGLGCNEFVFKRVESVQQTTLY